MKKYAISNLLFTVFFLAILGPLCYLLFNYVVNFGLPPVAAKQSLSEMNISPISVNRDFSLVEEYADKVPVQGSTVVLPNSNSKGKASTESELSPLL
jgi:hypothetical protein